MSGYNFVKSITVTDHIECSVEKIEAMKSAGLKVIEKEAGVNSRGKAFPAKRIVGLDFIDVCEKIEARTSAEGAPNHQQAILEYRVGESTAELRIHRLDDERGEAYERRVRELVA